jgi:hypothetical protein
MPVRSNSLTRAALRVQLNRSDVDYLIDELRDRFHGREPALGDLIWGHLNRRLLDHAKDHKWGLYRNAKLTMAGQLYSEARVKDAVCLLCEVMFLDLNGANNAGMMQLPDGSRQQYSPDFDLTTVYPAPAVISALMDLSTEAHLDQDGLAALFKTRTSVACARMGAPLTIDETWDKVASLLYDELPE